MEGMGMWIKRQKPPHPPKKKEAKSATVKKE